MLNPLALAVLAILTVSPQVGQAPLSVRVTVRAADEWRGRVCLEIEGAHRSCWDADPEDEPLRVFTYRLDAGEWEIRVTHRGKVEARSSVTVLDSIKRRRVHSGKER